MIFIQVYFCFFSVLPFIMVNKGICRPKHNPTLDPNPLVHFVNCNLSVRQRYMPLMSFKLFI